MERIQNKERIFHFMQTGASIITPNNRLSLQWLDELLRAQQTPVQNKPHCLPYPAFLLDLYKRARHLYAQQVHPMVLNPLQERYAWQSLLNQSQWPVSEGLLDEVQEAWQHCQDWQVSFDDLHFAKTPQTRQFQQWCQQFQQLLKEKNALSQAQLVRHILNYPDLFTPSMRFVWVCFDRFSPMQEALQAQIAAAGCEQYHYDLAPHACKSQYYAACDVHDEYGQMIQWLKTKLQQGKKRIAVVIPDLHQQSAALQRLLQQHLASEQFNLSLGHRLNEHPLVAHALIFLQLTKTLSNHHARLLLHSPYLQGSKTEALNRAEAAEQLKLLQEENSPLQKFIQALKTTCPLLAEALSQQQDDPQEASATDWVQHFKERLLALGFPGEYPLNSESYQYCQCFFGLFDELLSLSLLSPRLSRAEALQALQDLTHNTIFQIQKPKTPIQFLGLLEASGAHYDALWICGLTDQCLPEKTRLSAFIPQEIQRAQQMPHTEASRELAFAKQLLRRLQDGSDEAIFSYPRLKQDSPQLPSPLLHDFTAFSPPASIKTHQASECVTFQDIERLELKAGERLKGGTQLLAKQAQCPFRAFAAYRLHAHEPLKISHGLNASERGQAMHRLMELIWKKLGQQQQLLALTQESLAELVNNAIEQTLMPWLAENRISFSGLVQDLERDRLQRLVGANLEWEKQRPAFEILALEQEFSLQINQLDFRVRIDRLDKVGPNKWVIDYKSRLPSTKPWNDERPDAPQLLLYALLDQEINTLIFIELNAGKLFVSGLSEQKLELSGITPLKKDETWPLKQQHWQDQLNLLAQELQDGYCQPKPHRESLCQTCDYANLCRYKQSALNT
jgi:ATP-dependent helicase/nuclease subunit B